MADIVEELLCLCDSYLRHSAQYHLQTNGLTERNYCKHAIYISSNHKNWDDILSFITCVFNAATQETTGYSSFFLLYARPLQRTIDTVLPFSSHENLTVAETLCLSEKMRRIARLWPLASRDRWKMLYDIRHRPVTYRPGDIV